MLPRQPVDHQLTDRRGVSFAFDSGCTALDFAYTGGDGRYAVFEILHHPTDLAGWLSRSDLSLPTVPVDGDGLAAA